MPTAGFAGAASSAAAATAAAAAADPMKNGSSPLAGAEEGGEEEEEEEEGPGESLEDISEFIRDTSKANATRESRTNSCRCSSYTDH